MWFDVTKNYAHSGILSNKNYNITDNPRNKLRDDLIKAQYEQIKDAIKSTRQRMHQISIAGVISFPAGIFLAHSKSLDASSLPVAFIFILSPVIILAFALLYRSEKEAMSKYGHYINFFIDPLMSSKPDKRYSFPFITWEEFRRRKLPSQANRYRGPYEYNRNLSLRLLIGTYTISGCALSSYYICSFIINRELHPFLFPIVFFSIAYFEAVSCWQVWSSPQKVYKKESKFLFSIFLNVTRSSIMVPRDIIKQIYQLIYRFL